MQQNIIDAKGDNKYIALLGDIGDPTLRKNNNYLNLIANLSKEYHDVFVVAGNHEYYTSRLSDKTIDEVNHDIERVCGIFEDNVHFMNNSTLKLYDHQNECYTDVIIAGTTLWSHIPDEHAHEVKRYINDFCKIPKFSIDRQNELHNKSIKFIEDTIDTYRDTDKSVVMLTHHAPYNKGTSPPIYENQVTNCAFATDLTRLMKPPIKRWCFGHTHYQSDIEINGVSIISNPLGYGRELQRYGQQINFAKSIKLLKL